MSELVTPAQGAPRAASPLAWPEPYALLFPLGVLFAIAGTAPWLLLGVGAVAWPGSLHMALMIEGFEQSFVIGFLLTAMPSFTGGPRCRPWESGAAVGLLATFACFAFAGPAWAAEAAYVATLLLIVWALVSRVARSRRAPPEEFVFVALGLLFGLAGAIVVSAQPMFGWAAAAPRLGERLHSLGMVLSIVLGVGGLLVPTFIGVREPLRVPGFAAPHERGGRRRLYVPVALALIAAFVLEASGHPWAGALTRALAASALLLLVWKLWRPPHARGILAHALPAAGWMLFAGLWLAVWLPGQAIAAYHVVFIGGFGLLTLGIATRVTVAHGHHPLADEQRLLTPWILVLLGLAIALRLAAAFAPGTARVTLAAGAALWMLAWALWAARALPRMLRTSPVPPAAGVSVVRGPR